MNRLITTIRALPLFLFILAFCPIIDVEAGVDSRFSWYLDSVVDQTNFYLEIGGCPVPDDNPARPHSDVWYTILQGDSSNLYGFQMSQGDPTVVTTFNVPGNGPVFAISQDCQVLDGNNKIVFAYPDNGQLIATVCDNSIGDLCLNNDQFLITNAFTDFAEAQVFKDPNQSTGGVYAIGCRSSVNETVWYSTPTGAIWDHFVSVSDTRCAINGGTRVNGGVNNGSQWIFYGDATNIPYNLTIRDLKTGVLRVVDSDFPGGNLKESCAVSLPNGHNLVTWFNNSGNAIRGAIFPSPLNNPGDVDVIDYGPPPDFASGLGFFGIGCTAMGDHLVKVSYPGGNDFIVNTENYQVTQVPPAQTPYFTVDSGPLASNELYFISDPTGLPDGSNILWGDIFLTGNSSVWPESLHYAQFAIVTGLIIPTLSEWGMIAAAAGLVLVGVFFAVRRRRAANS